jgi:hypothetical protein
MHFFNSKRLRNYPKIFLITIAVAFMINIVTHDGWLGGGGKIIGSDFVTLYGAGELYRENIDGLYDFGAQYEIQQELIHPTQLPGLNPFISPPYVAFLYSIMTTITLPVSFAVNVLCTLVAIVLAVFGMVKMAPGWLLEAGLGRKRLLILVASFFPFSIGLLVGQNHGFTLLLITGIVLFSISGRWTLAGILAAALIYKPQFVLGFLILWLVWKEFKAIFSFAVSAGILVGSPIIQYGMQPFLEYFSISSTLWDLPYITGFPGSLLVTPYGMLTTLLPVGASSSIRALLLILFILLGIGLAWFGIRDRERLLNQRSTSMILALLFPLLATPYVLVHDLVILVPAFILWTHETKEKLVLSVAIFTYIGGLVFPIFGDLIHIAFVAILPITFFIAFLYSIFRTDKGVMELVKSTGIDL